MRKFLLLLPLLFLTVSSDDVTTSPSLEEQPDYDYKNQLYDSEYDNSDTEITDPSDDSNDEQTQATDLGEDYENTNEEPAIYENADNSNEDTLILEPTVYDNVDDSDKETLTTNDSDYSNSDVANNTIETVDTDYTNDNETVELPTEPVIIIPQLTKLTIAKHETQELICNAPQDTDSNDIVWEYSPTKEDYKADSMFTIYWGKDLDFKKNTDNLKGKVHSDENSNDLKVTADDFTVGGFYRCRLRNNDGEATFFSTMEVVVYQQPQVKMESLVDAVAGKNMRVLCNVFNASPKASVSIQLNDSPLSPDQLTITDLQQTEPGTSSQVITADIPLLQTDRHVSVTCEASDANNLWNPTSDSKSVDLEYSPTIPEIRNQNIIADSQEGVTIECITDSNPIANIEWKFDNDTLKSLADHVDSKLVFTNLPIIYHESQITCVATNQHGINQVDAKLTVLAEAPPPESSKAVIIIGISIIFLVIIVAIVVILIIHRNKEQNYPTDEEGQSLNKNQTPEIDNREPYINGVEILPEEHETKDSEVVA